MQELALQQKPEESTETRTFLHDENGFLNLSEITGTLSGIVKVIVVLVIIGATVGLLFTAIADIVAAFASGTTNSPVADLLLPVMGLLVALAGVFLIVRLVFKAAS